MTTDIVIRYESSYAKEAKGLCERGASESDLARHFKCTVWDVRLWCATHKDFAAAVRVGQDVSDQRVEMALYQRATGFSYDEVKVTLLPGVDAKGEPREMRAVTTKWVPGDVGAQQFWLKNRRPAEWTDKVTINHTANADIRDITNEELLRIATGGSAGTTEPSGGPRKPGSVH